jgi:hypothetical protein
LAAVLERRATAGRRGIFLSLPSTRVLRIEQVDVARKAGIGTALLWGLPDLCEAARRRRDEADGRQFNAVRYAKSNADAFREYGSGNFDSVRIETFEPSGARREVRDIADSIIRLLANIGLQPTAASAMLSRRG